MSTLDNQKLEVWFLTGTQSLYGEQTLETVAQQSKEVSALLAQSINSPVDIIFKPI